MTGATTLRSIFWALLLLVGGCSTVPEAIRQAPDGSIALSQAREAPAAYRGQRVRWGGTIARVENRQQETRIEVVGRSLYSDGEPKEGDSSAGRFIVRFEGFLDPAIYAAERRLTVVGTLSGSEERQLGQMRYRYPVVNGEAYHLWPQPVEVNDHYDPWFYDPWHPWYPSPWYRNPYY
ncbi:MAG: Slp family lipoprotein [Pseudomonadota bacterium]